MIDQTLEPDDFEPEDDEVPVTGPETDQADDDPHDFDDLVKYEKDDLSPGDSNLA